MFCKLFYIDQKNEQGYGKRKNIYLDEYSLVEKHG